MFQLYICPCCHCFLAMEIGYVFFLRFKSKEDNEMTSLFQLLRRQIQQSCQWPYVSKFDAILNSSAVVYRRIQDFPPKTRGRVQCVTKGPDEFVLTV